MNDYSQSSSNPLSLSIFALLYVIFFGVLIIALWKTYRKSGKPGWTSIIPIYNLIVLLQIVKKPGWWVLLFLVPLVNIVIAIIVYLELAKAFGKSTVFGIFFLILLSPIGFMILGFGKSQYVLGQQAPLQPPVPPQTPQPTTPLQTPAQ